MTSPTPAPPLKGRGSSDKGWRPEAPPLQGRGLGWGLSNAQLAELHARAAEMRRNPTEPEKRLWRHLSRAQLDGHKFRRQSVIYRYIVDFLCPKKALIIELDGDSHDDPSRDARRDAQLAEMGFRVLRFGNRDALSNMDGVIEGILAALHAAPDRWPDTPHPNPSPEEEGLNKGEPESPYPSGEGLGVGPVSSERDSLEGSVG